MTATTTRDPYIFIPLPRFLRNCVTFDSTSKSLGSRDPDGDPTGFSNRSCSL